MFADELRKQRVIRGYSQEYMAECLGISQRQYSRLETNDCKITLKRLFSISKIFEIPVSELYPPPQN
jgi:transcriptional regulator with XRE-family HTH domain